MITGNDGQGVAAIKVITNGKSVILSTPISCLHPLEMILESDTDLNNQIDDIEMANEVDDSMPRSRPDREAAQKSREQVHKWMTD